MGAAQTGYSNEQLAGFTIGVTADRRSEDLIAALVRRGAEVLHAPTLRIKPTEEDDQLVADTRTVLQVRPDFVLATTSYGFSGWLEAADAAGLGQPLIEILAASTILVRGPKARGAVRAAGLKEQGSGAEETTASLVDLLLQRDVGGRTVLVQLHGYVDQDQLDRITGAGARVLTVAPYRWSPPPDTRAVERLIEAICGRLVDAVTFTSAPAADALLQAADRLGVRQELVAALESDVLPVAVGNVTAAPLRAAGLEPVHPDRFRLGALVRTVCEEMQGRVIRADTAAGPVELRGRLAIFDGRSVMLPPSGALILKALVRAKGSVVPKDQLRAMVAGDDHALEVAVGRLRSSLAAPGLVRTVVRRGYRLDGA
jgi:uroporphyrinogen-III synthase